MMISSGLANIIRHQLYLMGLKVRFLHLWLWISSMLFIVSDRNTLSRTFPLDTDWTNGATIIPPDTARKGCNWKNKILIEFVTRAFPSCFDGKILYPNQSNFVPLVIPSLGPLDPVAVQSLDHSRKYEITTNIIVVYFTHCPRKINNMFIIDRNVTAFAQCNKVMVKY